MAAQHSNEGEQDEEDEIAAAAPAKQHEQPDHHAAAAAAAAAAQASAGQQLTRTTTTTEITLLSLNCWGLLHISALRAPRLAEIGRQIAILAPVPDIVCLQECWVHDDYLAVRDATRAVLPHGKFYHSGSFGGGLAILSRWPIEESSMFPYSLNGRPTAFWRGDWYVGKGVAAATVRFGPAEQHVIEVLNTHTHAPYESGPDDSYLCHRTAQAWDIAKLIRGAIQKGRLVVALGDFNMTPLSLPHRIITSLSPIRDTWRVLHPDSSVGSSDQAPEKARGRPVPTAEYNLVVNGAASDTVYNTWRWTKDQQKKLKTDPCPVDPDTHDPRGKRIDYVFASTGAVSTSSATTTIASSASSSSSSSGSSVSGGRRGWVVKSTAVELTGRHPTLNCSLSDHFAVRATLQQHTLPSDNTTARSELDAQYDEQLRYDERHANALTLSDYDEMLAMTQKYTARERRQRFWRGVHFHAALVVWLACLVAVWFSPRSFVTFLLMLLASLGLTAGVIDGLLALLFFSREIRGLKEFEWEIQNARAAAVSKGVS
ncbi:Endonuclease/exonuclease/phosphatase [Moelleriella libera RCEF 2490]|uniref:Endonuclease/exonuclease/phosphatase n=1 Tax=Moelleriella libera RCEF 2490 TaxID=1081109 RepID=A0A168BZ96_9HYPO|nr:Endonuclease/exonuclease/phosphatase [Moelleriella libera RCEF 2490]